MKVRERRRKSGQREYYMDFRFAGQRVRKVIPCAKSRTEAREIAEIHFADLKRRELLGDLAGPTASEQSLTLSALLEADRKRVGIADSTRTSERFQPACGPLPEATIADRK